MVYARYELSPENSSKMGRVGAFWPEAQPFASVCCGLCIEPGGYRFANLL